MQDRAYVSDATNACDGNAMKHAANVSDVIYASEYRRRVSATRNVADIDNVRASVRVCSTNIASLRQKQQRVFHC